LVVVVVHGRARLLAGPHHDAELAEVKSEVLPLQWRQADLKAGVVRLEPGTTKNGEGRMFFATPELRACLEAQRAGTEALQREIGRIIPWVFHRNGERIKCFRKA
jgi:integrase